MKSTKKDVVVLALYSLQGTTRIVDTEDIAIAAHLRAPKAFGWRKHSENIDLDTVRTSLRHEKESPNPRLDGSIRDGWHLTPAGQSWVAEQAEAGQSQNSQVAPASLHLAVRRAETHEVATAVNRLRASSAYSAWESDSPVLPRDAAAVFRIDEYTPQRDRILKTAKIRELVSDHPNLIQFVDYVVPVALGFDKQLPRTPK